LTQEEIHGDRSHISAATGPGLNRKTAVVQDHPFRWPMESMPVPSPNSWAS
jgi:hypothetical protein